MKTIGVPWQQKVAGSLRHLASQIDPHERPAGETGRRLRFTQIGDSLGYPVYAVHSVKGAVYIGQLEWSNQWRDARFKPAPDAVFDRVCLAELFAACKLFR